MVRKTTFLLLLVSALAALAVQVAPGIASAQQPGIVCPDCGKIHPPRAGGFPTAASGANAGVMQSGGVVVQAGAVIPTSYAMSAHSVSGNGSSNVLGMLNGQRARQGVGALSYDPQLQAVAERRAQQMAQSGSKGHPPGSFSPGTHEGVGWSSSFSPSGVSACYTSDSRMRYAGAAMAYGRDGCYFAVVYR